jgi:hypothetical protein
MSSKRLGLVERSTAPADSPYYPYAPYASTKAYSEPSRRPADQRHARKDVIRRTRSNRQKHVCDQRFFDESYSRASLPVHRVALPDHASNKTREQHRNIDPVARSAPTNSSFEHIALDLLQYQPSNNSYFDDECEYSIHRFLNSPPSSCARRSALPPGQPRGHTTTQSARPWHFVPGNSARMSHNTARDELGRELESLSHQQGGNSLWDPDPNALTGVGSWSTASSDDERMLGRVFGC